MEIKEETNEVAMSPRKAFSFAMSGILEAKSEEALEK
jgi:hypothetical protein